MKEICDRKEQLIPAEPLSALHGNIHAQKTRGFCVNNACENEYVSWIGTLAASVHDMHQDETPMPRT